MQDKDFPLEFRSHQQDRQRKIGIVRDNDSPFVVIVGGIDKKIGGQVDIRSFLFARKGR